MLRQEFLRERQSKRRGDPADFHNGHETRADRGADLVEGACAGDDGHGNEVDGVLDGGDLDGGYCQHLTVCCVVGSR